MSKVDLQGIDIRPLVTHDDLRAAEEVQRLAWGMPDLEIVPMHMLVAFILHGGVSLGAWDGDQQVGFVVGYPGFFEDPDDPRAVELGSRHFHASQMMGILPAYQNQGIGYALKLAQRRAVLAQGFRLALWTFDPLLSRNAYFNITGLGCVVRRYIHNLYDEMTGINAGMPSDRFEVEWWLDNRRVEDTVAGKAETRTPSEWREAGTPIANPTTAPGDFRAPPDSNRFPGEPRLLVEIPGDIDAIKAADMGLAKAWRYHIRELMDDAFRLGCAVTGFATEGQGAHRRSYYVVEREFKIN